MHGLKGVLSWGFGIQTTMSIYKHCTQPSIYSRYLTKEHIPA